MFAGRDMAGRELRISGHPEADRIVLSIWQTGRCVATVRLARADVPEVIRALTEGLVAVPSEPRSEPGSVAGPTPDARTGATVHELRPGGSPAEPRAAPTVAAQVGDLAENLTTRLTTWLRRR
jgi:hypothetical protein